MRVLVTGATGFTGSHVAAELARRGHQVRAIVRREGPSHLWQQGVEFVSGDLRDPDAVRAAASNVEVIYHVAAAFRQAKLPAAEYYRINVDGTKNVLDAAVSQGVRRVVHTSTIGVHGDVENIPANEDSPFKPGDDYQKSKLQGEMLAWAYHKRRDLEVAVVRPAAIYGPGDGRLLKMFRMIAKGRYLILGDGEVPLHMSYIDDLVQGYLLCGEKDTAVGKPFIIAHDEYATHNRIGRLVAEALGVAPPRLHLPAGPFFVLGDICETLCRPLGVEPPLHRRRVAFFTKARAFSIDRAKTLLGYHPQISLDEGIRRTAEGYVAAGLIPAGRIRRAAA